MNLAPMNRTLRNFGRLFHLGLVAVLWAGCKTAGDVSAASLQAGSAPTRQTVRVVNANRTPVAGVAVTVYPESGKPSPAGSTAENGEIVLPVAPHNLYLFTLNRRTLLGQTAENLFSLTPSGAMLYQRDGNVVIVPVVFSDTNSPLVSPVVDPLKTTAQRK